MRKVLQYIAVFALFQANAVYADGVIIGNGIDFITEEQVRDLYLGRATTIAGKVIYLTDCKPLQKEFLEEIIDKSIRKYKKDWVRMLFADGAVIPLELQTPEDVIDYIKRTPNSLGYVPALPENSGNINIKVLLIF
jgi:hypothetical protein